MEGCFWACPYEVVFFDFTEPELLPYKEFLRADDLGRCHGWLDKDTFRMTQEIHVRKSDNRPYRELSENERAEIDKDYRLGAKVEREVLVTREQILRDTD